MKTLRQMTYAERLAYWQEHFRADDAEKEAEQGLARRVIAAGYRALAKRLHPDKGGSPEAMARLTRIRDQLKKIF